MIERWISQYHNVSNGLYRYIITIQEGLERNPEVWTKVWFRT